MFGSKEFVAYFLNVAAEAEDSDEGMFVRIAEAVPEELRAGLAKHAADEARHAVLLRECVVRNGGTPTAVPEDLRLFHRLLDAAGIADPAAQLMEFFLLLQLAEERAVKQYTAIAALMQETDPESARALESIAGDEAAHIVHCRVLATKFAPDVESMDAALVRLRKIEDKVFAAFALAVFAGAPCPT